MDALNRLPNARNGHAQTGPHPPTRTHKHRAYLELIEIQALVLSDIRNPETPPAARAQLARAYDVCEERKRILRNRPLPGSLRPDVKPNGKTRSTLARTLSLSPAPEPP